MSSCLLYIAIIDNRTKIGITKNWSNRRNTYLRKGSREIRLIKGWNLHNRSTALSFEKLCLSVFSSKRVNKSEFLSISPEEVIAYVDHIFELMGYIKVVPPKHKKFTMIDLMPSLIHKLSPTLSRMNYKLAISDYS